MTLTVVTQPPAEPVELAEAKTHLRVDFDDHDDYIEGLVKAARRFAENHTGTVFIERTLKYTIDAFPELSSEAIIVPVAPIQSISSIIYTDTDGNEQTWSSDNYILDPDDKRPRILPAYEQDWPDTRDQINAVQITMKAGYAPLGSPLDYRTAVPDDIRHALKMLIGHWYEHGADVAMGTTVVQVPMASLSLLWDYKIKAF